MTQCRMAEEISKGMQEVDRRWKAAQIKHASERAISIRHKGLAHYIRLGHRSLHKLW